MNVAGKLHEPVTGAALAEGPRSKNIGAEVRQIGSLN